ISNTSRLVDSALENNQNPGRQEVIEFFDDYVFPTMARPENQNRLGELRSDFIKDYLNPKVRGVARQTVIQLTIDRMTKYSQNRTLAASTRINAVYLIGMLDQVPAVRLNSQPPRPSAEAMVSLKTILQSSDATAVPEYLKVAAIAGIKRHLDIDQTLGGSIVEAPVKAELFAFVEKTLKEPAKDDLNYWLQRRSMQIGGLLRNPAVADLIIKVLKEDQNSLWLKYDALESLNNLQLSLLSGQKQQELATVLGEFLKSNYNNEAALIRQAVDKLVYNSILFADTDLETNPNDYSSNSSGGIGSGKGGFPGGGGGMGGGMGGSEGDDSTGGFGGGFGGGPTSSDDEEAQLTLPNYQLHQFRQKIKAVGFTARKAMMGLEKSLTGDSKTYANRVISKLDYLLNEDSNHGIVDLDLPEKEPEPGAEPDPPAQEMLAKACEKFASAVGKDLAKLKGEPEPKDPAKEEDASAGDDPFK
ncbi:MAG: hypothetical protein AAF939_19900, partial [Planctomycetota bacterium]